MLKIPSLVNVAAVPYSGDRALKLPGIKYAGDMVDRHREELSEAKKQRLVHIEIAEIVARHKVEAEASAKGVSDDLALLGAAKETGDYSKILAEGAKVTWFHLRMIPGMAMREIYAAVSAGEISAFKQPAIAFRCAISKIENLEGISPVFVDDPRYGKIASEEIINELDAIDPAIVTEIGFYAIGRSSPKAK
jgi:SpoVK/Ycf46/Vps4 family AAA+-type ATPase